MAWATREFQHQQFAAGFGTRHISRNACPASCCANQTPRSPGRNAVSGKGNCSRRTPGWARPRRHHEQVAPRARSMVSVDVGMHRTRPVVPTGQRQRQVARQCPAPAACAGWPPSRCGIPGARCRPRTSGRSSRRTWTRPSQTRRVRAVLFLFVYRLESKMGGAMGSCQAPAHAWDTATTLCSSGGIRRKIAIKMGSALDIQAQAAIFSIATDCAHRHPARGPAINGCRRHAHLPWRPSVRHITPLRPGARRIASTTHPAADPARRGNPS